MEGPNQEGYLLFLRILIEERPFQGKSLSIQQQEAEAEGTAMVVHSIFFGKFAQGRVRRTWRRRH